jgi:hypothetical protein
LLYDHQHNYLSWMSKLPLLKLLSHNASLSISYIQVAAISEISFCCCCCYLGVDGTECPWQVSHYLAYFTSPGWWVWSSLWNVNWHGKLMSLEETYSSAFVQHKSWPRSEQDHCSRKLVTNHLIYHMALSKTNFWTVLHFKVSLRRVHSLNCMPVHSVCVINMCMLFH